MSEDIFKQFRTSGFMKVMNKTFDTIAKTKKATWKAMGTAVKTVKKATDLLSAFGSTSLITKIFDKVISNYTTYLSDIFWGKVVKGLDFDAINTAIIDTLGPVLEGIGTLIGDAIKAAPIGTTVGAAIGYLIKGPIGALIGGMIGFGIETLGNALQGIMGSVGTIEESENPMDVRAIGRYYAETGKIAGGMLDEDYMRWWYNRYRGPIFPSLQFGGIIPKTGLYKLHKKEEVISAKERGSRGDIVINIDLRNAVIDNVDRLSQRIAEQVMIRIG